jgi:hypothetical protein
MAASLTVLDASKPAQEVEPVFQPVVANDVNWLLPICVHTVRRCGAHLCRP